MAHPTGRFEKIVEAFADGVGDLTDISFSAAQSIHQGLDGVEIGYLESVLIDEYENPYSIPRWSTISPMMVVAACAVNSTGGEYGTPCGITDFTWGGCEYMTSRGVVFGWEYVDEYPVGRYRFWIIHPDAGMRSDDSSLRKSALEQGWEEVIAEETRFRDGHTEHRHPPDDYMWHPVGLVHEEEVE